MRCDSLVDAFVSRVKALPCYVQSGVDLINRSLSYLADNDLDTCIVKAKKLRPVVLGHEPWSIAEIDALQEAVAHHGNNLESIADELKSKSLADIVKRYYITLG